MSKQSKKKKARKKKKLPLKKRNPFALAALSKKAGPMKDRRTPRAGAKKKDYLNDDY